MRGQILWAIIRKELLHIFRDGQTWILVMFTPALLLITFSYLFSLDVDRFDLAVWDQDHSAAARDYVRTLTADGVFEWDRPVSSTAEADDLMRASSIDAILVIPPGFEADLLAGWPATVQVHLDGSNPSTASQALGQLSARTTAYSRKVLLQGQPAGLFEVRERIWFNPMLASKNSMVPGLLAVVMFMPAFSAAQAVAKEKELGTLESLLSTPIGRADYVLGKALPYMVTGLAGVLSTTIVAVGWFHVPFRGSFLLFLLLSLTYLFASNAMAVMIATFVDSQQAAMIAMFLVFFLPSFFLSGLIDPLESAGLGARIEGMLLPTSYFVTIARGVFLKGVGLAELWRPALSLIGLGLGALGIAIAAFRVRLA